MTAAEALEAMREDAFEQVAAFAEATCAPEIIADLASIIDRNQRAVIWEASTAYGVGAVVQMYPRNGHRYMAVTAGTSAATSAAFPVTLGYYSRDAYSVTDGTVGWQQVGSDYANVFDVRAAIHEACMLKASKASTLIDQSGISASQVQRQWRERAADFVPLGVA